MFQSMRATICYEIEDEHERELAEQWLTANREKLTFISDNEGCGCCINSWDIEGPDDIVRTLPPQVSADSGWTRGERYHDR